MPLRAFQRDFGMDPRTLIIDDHVRQFFVVHCGSSAMPDVTELRFLPKLDVQPHVIRWVADRVGRSLSEVENAEVGVMVTIEWPKWTRRPREFWAGKAQDSAPQDCPACGGRYGHRGGCIGMLTKREQEVAL